MTEVGEMAEEVNLLIQRFLLQLLQYFLVIMPADGSKITLRDTLYSGCPISIVYQRKLAKALPSSEYFHFDKPLQRLQSYKFLKFFIFGFV